MYCLIASLALPDDENLWYSIVHSLEASNASREDTDYSVRRKTLRPVPEKPHTTSRYASRTQKVHQPSSAATKRIHKSHQNMFTDMPKVYSSFSSFSYILMNRRKKKKRSRSRSGEEKGMEGFRWEVLTASFSPSCSCFLPYLGLLEFLVCRRDGVRLWRAKAEYVRWRSQSSSEHFHPIDRWRWSLSH